MSEVRKKPKPCTCGRYKFPHRFTYECYQGIGNPDGPSDQEIERAADARERARDLNAEIRNSAANVYGKVE